MKPRIVNPTDSSCPWPMCDVTNGRRDGPLVHLGEMAPVVTSAPAKVPANLHKATRVEYAAETLLGMVSKKRYGEALARIEELEADNKRMSELLDSIYGLEAAREKVRDALVTDAKAGPPPTEEVQGSIAETVSDQLEEAAA